MRGRAHGAGRRGREQDGRPAIEELAPRERKGGGDSERMDCGSWKSARSRRAVRVVARTEVRSSGCTAARNRTASATNSSGLHPVEAGGFWKSVEHRARFRVRAAIGHARRRVHEAPPFSATFAQGGGALPHRPGDLAQTSEAGAEKTVPRVVMTKPAISTTWGPAEDSDAVPSPEGRSRIRRLRPAIWKGRSRCSPARNTARAGGGSPATGWEKRRGGPCLGPNRSKPAR